MKDNSSDHGDNNNVEEDSLLRPTFNTRKEPASSNNNTLEPQYDYTRDLTQQRDLQRLSPVGEPLLTGRVSRSQSADGPTFSSSDQIKSVNSDGLCRSGSSNEPKRQSTAGSSGKWSKSPSETRKGFDWSGSWIWEICGALFSIMCIALMIGFLAYLDQMPYASWQYSISPNTVIAIIAAFAKASMLVPVSACLGQLKWKKDDQKPLYHFQVLDQASRGPWGALQVFWTIKSGFAIVAAALTILSLALDPFAQQILHFPSREVVMHNETAYIPRALVYVPDQVSDTYGSDQTMDQSMQVAFFTGLAGTSDPLKPTCSTGHCEFPDFSSLGICENCQDVTEQTVQDCQPLSPSANFEFHDILFDDDEERFKEFYSVPANCTYLTPSGFEFTPDIVDLYILSDPDGLDPALDRLGIRLQPLTSISNYTGDLSLRFAAFKYMDELVYSPKNLSTIGQKPEITECYLSICEKIYTQTHFTTNGPILQPSRTVPLVVRDSDWEYGLYGIDELPKGAHLSTKDGSTTFQNASYYISMSAMDDQDRLVDLLNTTYVDMSWRSSGVSSFNGLQLSPILFNSANISDSVRQMAVSMTDRMRSNKNSSHVTGTAYRTITYINVRWPWIILPAALVVLSALLFAAMIKTTRGDSVLWKSSVLPLMIGRLQTAPENDLTYERHLGSIETISRKVSLVVEDDRDQGLFVFSERQLESKRYSD